MPFPTSYITGDEDEIFVWGGASLIIENMLDEIDGQPADPNDVSPDLTKVTISTAE